MIHSSNPPANRGPARGGPMGGRGPLGGGPMAMMSKAEKPRDFKGTLNKLIEYLGHYKLLILFLWLLAIASTAAAIFGPKILGTATTTLFEGVMAQLAGTGTVDFSAISLILLQVFTVTQRQPFHNSEQ